MLLYTDRAANNYFSLKKGKATLFIHGLCLKLEACGAVYIKQILNKHNMIKNPNWQEADQLAIYKHDQGFELGTTENKFR